MEAAPKFEEDHSSQIPALLLLLKIGYSYLTSAEALELRAGRTAGALLDGILESQLRKINNIRHKGQLVPISEANIHTAIQALKLPLYDGLFSTNENIYDSLCLGKTVEQSIDGDKKSFTVRYIDWERPDENAFHVSEEFAVERGGSKNTFRVDLCLFVNGIPFCVIECKRQDLAPGKIPVSEAISQHIRNQKEDGIPTLYAYCQLLIAASNNAVKYATTGTPANFWSVWREPAIPESTALESTNRHLQSPQWEKVFTNRFSYARDYFESLPSVGDRAITEQDKSLIALCRRERLLEIAHRFIIYDEGEKKICRHQQYFAVKRIMSRIGQLEDKVRRGGLVWHTQGSGKSLTMVMLAKSILLDDHILDPKIILVTDRVDLDDQIYRTFQHCGVEIEQATTGKNLARLLSSGKRRVIATVIDKFEAAVSTSKSRNEGHNIFFLVDESHRTQYGPRLANMRRVFPFGCYIGFTGTPIMKRERNTVAKFGGLIEPPYTITEAVRDGMVVPLLYEGRHVAQRVDALSINKWFDVTTKHLSSQQKSLLKRKFGGKSQLGKTEQTIKRIAFDVSMHYVCNWQKTPFKAQLVAPDKTSALLYKKYFDEFGLISSEVLISPPDSPECEEDNHDANRSKVEHFWKQITKRYGTEKQYNRQMINAFKHGEPPGAPEIIVVVNKLLTDFDAPRNTVLYLARDLKGHTLLQAIARVNRLHEGKEFGYILDYRGVFENHDQVFDLYSALPDFEETDLKDTLIDINTLLRELPQKHAAVWDIFSTIKNSNDSELKERLLADNSLRFRFYDRFSAFARVLSLAFSNLSFLESTPERQIDQYQSDLKLFEELHQCVRRRYAEPLKFSEYEPTIRKLIGTHIGMDDVEQIIGPIDIFNREGLEGALAQAKCDASKADTIAHHTKRIIEKKWQEDPEFYKKWFDVLQPAIERFHAEQIPEKEYLRTSEIIKDAIINKSGNDVPKSLYEKDAAKAYYACVKDVIEKYGINGQTLESSCTVLSLRIDSVIQKRRRVNWTQNIDIQNRIRQEIEDTIFEMKDSLGIDLSLDEIDLIIDKTLEIAKVRCI